MDKEKKKITKIIAISILSIILYIILDFVNILSLLSIPAENLNKDVLSLIVNSTIVILLYIISYYLIDKKSITKDKNKTTVANILIIKTMEECKDSIKLLNQTQMVKKYIVPKVDFNKTDNENKVVYNIQNYPFDTYDDVFSLAKDGYVNKEIFNMYLDIRKEYRFIVSSKITFFDKDEIQKTPDQEELFSLLDEKESKLLFSIENIIRKLKGEN